MSRIRENAPSIFNCMQDHVHADILLTTKDDAATLEPGRMLMYRIDAAVIMQLAPSDSWPGRER